MFRLGFALGKTIDEIEQLDSRQLSEYLAYSNLYPMYDEWLAHGIQCSTMANLWSKTKTKPKDFIPARKPSLKAAFNKLKAFAGRKKD